MQILIGCAKDMTMKPELTVPFLSVPRFEKEAEENARQMAVYSSDELRDILGVSIKIADDVHSRYQQFFNDANLPYAAIALYNGVVFKAMEPGQFSADDFEYAQRHLWITSFLYGLLRPLDGIRPYRMEGKVELPGNGTTMFAFWRRLLTDVMIESIRQDDGMLIDLASSEMRLLFDWKKVEKSITVIKPDFYVEKNGKLTMPSVNAKKCRGAMTSWIIREKITDPWRLKDFSHNGLRYQGDDKAGANPVYY